jgi:hypothetical protein
VKVLVAKIIGMAVMVAFLAAGTTMLVWRDRVARWNSDNLLQGGRPGASLARLAGPRTIAVVGVFFIVIGLLGLGLALRGILA